MRLSTDKETQRFDSQESELTTYCRNRGWDDSQLAPFYDRCSGTKAERSGLEMLLKEIRAGKVDVVCVYKLDRLGRSLAHLCMLLEEFKKRNVSLIATSQGIDTSNDNPAARFQVDVLMAVAAFERSIISERVAAGLRASKAKGIRLGRKPMVHKHKSRVLELRQQGLSHVAIGERVGISAASVCRLLKTG